jgi:hypothetical protein
MLVHLIKNLYLHLALLLLFSDSINSSYTDLKTSGFSSTTVGCSATCNTTCYNTSTQQCVNNSIVCDLYTPVAICTINAYWRGPNVLQAQCYNPYFQWCIDNNIVCSLDQEVCMVANWFNYSRPGDLIPQCYSRQSQICFDKTRICSFVDMGASLCHNPDCFNSSTYCGSVGVSKAYECNCGVYTQCYDSGTQTCAMGGKVCDGLHQAACNVSLSSTSFHLACYDPRYAQCYNNSILHFTAYNNVPSLGQYRMFHGMVVILLTSNARLRTRLALSRRNSIPEL